MKYTVNKKLFRMAFWISLTLLIILTFVDGINIYRSSATITCPETIPKIPCQFTFQDGTKLILEQGETYQYRPPSKNVKIINYTILTIALLTTLINHLLYNKNYGLKEFKQNFTEQKIRKIIRKEFDYYILNHLKTIAIWFNKKVTEENKDGRRK